MPDAAAVNVQVIVEWHVGGETIVDEGYTLKCPTAADSLDAAADDLHQMAAQLEQLADERRAQERV